MLDLPTDGSIDEKQKRLGLLNWLCDASSLRSEMKLKGYGRWVDYGHNIYIYIFILSVQYCNFITGASPFA
jgi:hypothetical protein